MVNICLCLVREGFFSFNIYTHMDIQICFQTWILMSVINKQLLHTK